MANFDKLDVRGNCRLGDLSRGNYTEIESDGTVLLNGNATVWDDVYPSSVSVGTTGSNVPSFTAYNGNLKGYEFVGSTSMKEINLGFQFPHDYKEGSNIEPHAHWFIPSSVSGGVIKIGLEYTWANKDDIGTINTTTVYSYYTVPANSDINNNAIISYGSINGLGKRISSILMCRIFRDPNDVEDTFSSSIWLKSADVHVQKDTLGSRQTYIK